MLSQVRVNNGNIFKFGWTIPLNCVFLCPSSLSSQTIVAAGEIFTVILVFPDQCFHIECSELPTVPNGPTEKAKRNGVLLLPGFLFWLAHTHIHTQILVTLWLSVCLFILTVHYENILLGPCVCYIHTVILTAVLIFCGVMSHMSNCFPFFFWVSVAPIIP